MLAYFPTLYKDELLYSGIARYHMNSGNKTQRQTIEDLFDNQLVCSAADLPSHLDTLISRINSSYSSEQLIRNHTLFPYYATFMSQCKIEHSEWVMKNGAAQGTIHANLGLLASKVKIPKYLRFCRECYKAETEACEPYWHVSHQLPGVSICPLHRTSLVISKVECGTENHKFEYVALSKIREEGLGEVGIDTNWMDTLIYIAEQSIAMLRSSGSENSSKPEYKKMLYSKGYLTPKGRVEFKKLIQNFRHFYGDELLEHLNCEVMGVSETWLHKIIRTPEEIRHPLRHILVVKFIGNVAKSLSSHSQSPFGNASWPCLNKAAGHYRLDVIESCKISRCTKTKQAIGTFQCSCGFIYSRTGPDQSSDDRYRIGRIKEFGQEWYMKLSELNATTLSLRKKAKELGVDPGTVKNQLEVMKNSRMIKPARIFVEQAKQSLSSIQMKEMGNIPKLSPSNYVRINWGERDELLLEAVINAVTLIKDAPEPQRISLAAIKRVLTKVPKDMTKLPKTNAYIIKSMDSTESFQIRRIIWAAKKLEATDGRILGWRLLKVAGLNHPLIDSVQKKFDEILNLPTRHQ
ncbi:hypothetical protein QW71_05210 [Paenibacillus sp. IHB B 3415]|uniref:TnsD family Tn7-like transposition protein n=1 Tax=Paenibacillus sp. IHB B 3415 TaxID=867080 RepID=UPI000574805B|nr:TnsD family Tn7-like transposition protein [Paenibacillus sp. IHB B 3415]KHL96794.1 hypothetical protein QW71_05210 [Paenibacillus sp. IHB B 3415]